MVQLGSEWRLYWHRCVDGNGELDLSGPERDRHSAGCISRRPGETQFRGCGAGRYARIVSGLSHHVLGVATNRPPVDREIWPLRPSWSQKTRTGRALAGSLPSWRSFLRAAASSYSPFDLDSRRDRSDEFWAIQFCYARRVGALVLDISLSWRQGVSHRARTSNESRGAGPFYPWTVARNIARDHSVRRPLHVNGAIDEAPFRPIIRANRLTDFRWTLDFEERSRPDSASQGILCSKVEQKCRRMVSLKVHKH